MNGAPQTRIETTVPDHLRTSGVLQWARAIPSIWRDPARVFAAGLDNHHVANTAYPIAHRKTIWPYRQERGHARLLADSLRAAGTMSLYVHIPFCEKRCSFCEYTVVDRHTEEVEAAYHEALIRELRMYLELLGERTMELAGLDIGGGTPALVSPARTAELLEAIRRGFRLAPGFSVSIETTPKIAATDPGRMSALRRLGIDRMSMGLQMVNPRLLRQYGRDLNELGHNRRAVDNIRAAGFERFNIDLMYGFAKQSLEDFRSSLEYTVDLDPEYITLYRMRYKGTRIRGEASEVELARVTRLYEEARRVLLAAGYEANPGKNGFSRVEGDPGTSAYLTDRVVWGTPYLASASGRRPSPTTCWPTTMAPRPSAWTATCRRWPAVSCRSRTCTTSPRWRAWPRWCRWPSTSARSTWGPSAHASAWSCSSSSPPRCASCWSEG